MTGLNAYMDVGNCSNIVNTPCGAIFATIIKVFWPVFTSYSYHIFDKMVE